MHKLTFNQNDFLPGLADASQDDLNAAVAEMSAEDQAQTMQYTLRGIEVEVSWVVLTLGSPWTLENCMLRPSDESQANTSRMFEEEGQVKTACCAPRISSGLLPSSGTSLLRPTCRLQLYAGCALPPRANTSAIDYAKSKTSTNIPIQDTPSLAREVGAKRRHEKKQTHRC